MVVPEEYQLDLLEEIFARFFFSEDREALSIVELLKTAKMCKKWVSWNSTED